VADFFARLGRVLGPERLGLEQLAELDLTAPLRPVLLVDLQETPAPLHRLLLGVDLVEGEAAITSFASLNGPSVTLILPF